MDFTSKVAGKILEISKAFEKQDQKALTDLFKLDSINAVQEIRFILDEKPDVFTTLCQYGFYDILEYLLGNLPMDTVINNKSNGMTGLQHACKEGHTDIVALLLKTVAKLNENIWEEQSEFYLASQQGHYDIIQLLLRERSDLVEDSSKCYCLFHGACKGGHVGMMQKWLRPDMDVNTEVCYVSSLNECENQFPLYAACHGNHLEAAEFLIGDLKARITKKICDVFPEFISKVVNNLFKTEDHGKRTFVMADLDLECVLPMWFEATDESDQDRRSSDIIDELEIDLSENKLSKLPAELLWEMSDLIHLCASHNPLHQLPEAPSAACLQLNSLTSLDLSFCKFERLNIAVFCLQNLKSLNASHNFLEELYENSDTPSKWKCKLLKELDLSHNILRHLPLGIQECTDLEIISLCYNQLTTLCPPWQCPLKNLDISNNKINSFPPSADHFWAKTLKKLIASHNVLDQIPESVVKMKCLSYLDMSMNKISSIPDSLLWLCPLTSLNLSHNELGSTLEHSTSKSIVSLKKSRRRTVLTFPGDLLKNTLTELDLSHNDLFTLPEGICDLKSLSFLDLSFNSHLTSLPWDIGRLRNLIVLELKGLKLQSKEIQEAVNAMDDPKKKCQSASDFVKFMERKRRKCRNHDVIKMVVFGCKNLGGQCVVRKLISETMGSDCRPQDSYRVTLEVADLTMRYTRKYQTRCKRNIQFRIWEMPDIKLTSTVHPCFLTQNSLYLVIHDVSSLLEDINKVSSQILAIQSCVTLPSIIVVGLFPSLMDQEYKMKLQQSLQVKFMSKFKCEFVPVAFSDKMSWDELRQMIYITTCGMPDSSVKKSYLIDREVPESFVEAYEKISALKLPIYDMEQFTQETGLKLSDFDDKIGDKLTLHEHLLQVGAMLHYDVQMSDLTNFVIINPTWLFDLLSYFLKNFVIAGRKQAKMSRDKVEKFMQKKIEDKFFKPFISLLEFSNIAIQIMESKGKESLLIPSLLSKHAQFLMGEEDDSSLKTSRFYPLPAVPASLWSHVISRLISAIDRFSNPTWKFEELGKQNSCDSSQSLRLTRQPSVRGLHVINKGLHYWRTGIHIWHDQGSVVVEQVKYQPGSNLCSEGILITAKTTKHGRQSNPSEDITSKNANLKKLAIIGIVKDELEEVLELFHPKFHDPFGSFCKPMALCPNCYNIKPGVGIIQEEITHFYVRDCAQRILWESPAFCNHIPVFLDQLMPELLFLELPSKFVIAPSDLEITSVNLGHGMAGTVSKGYHKGKEVAVKVFHQPLYEPAYLKTDDENENYPNIGHLSKLELSTIDQDRNDTEERKISNAFSDIRREVGILSKLKHKCIIAFIGVCVRRQVVLVMQLAPYGSLRSQLEKAAPVQTEDEVEDDLTITSSVFGKDLTYKIILQVSSGLSYLHKNCIIFRDLKPDNILVMSMDVNVAINVKLSDYGISKFSTPQGVSGLIGTIAYMAPEVIAKQTYTNKIDIYSLGLVMFETLTGIPPLSDDNKPLASQRNIDFDTSPEHVKKVTLNVNFLPLENLMSKCWSFHKEDRPEATSVVKMLKSDAFMILHDALWLPLLPTQDIHITCAYSCKSLGRWTLWISESAYNSSLQDRFMSVYDLKSSRYSVWRKKIPGLIISHMAKVGNKIWVACKGSKQLEELVRGKENKLEIKAGQTLDDLPTSLLCHRIMKNQKEDHCVLLVGQVNGSITTFSFSDSSQRSLMMMTSLSLDNNNAILNIVSVREDLIVASCGYRLFFLDVQKEIICQNDVHLLLSIQSTFSCFQDLNIREPVISLSAQDDSIWCIFKDTNLLIKLECESKEVLESVCFTWEPSRDQVRAEQISGPPFLTSMSSGASKHPQSCIWRRTVEEAENERSATLPANMRPPDFNPGMGPNDNIYEGQECDEMHLEDSFDDNAIYHSMDATGQPIDQKFEDDKPPLPPRSRPTTTTKVLDPIPESPRVSVKPPPLPKRLSNSETKIELTAICICSDLLAVGSHCGGFVLIPVKCTDQVMNKKQAVFPSKSVQCPVLRHPPRKSLKKPVPFSTLTTSNPKTGIISDFLVAEQKLISLYKSEDRDISARSSRDRIARKRFGIHVDSESPETVRSLVKDPNASNSSDDGSNDAKMVDDKERETDLPNIVVWGDLSSERLEIISSYGRSLES